MESIEEKLKEVDLVHVSNVDLCGIPRGKVVPARHIPRLLKSGLNTYVGTLACGIGYQLAGVPEEITSTGNTFMELKPETFYIMPQVEDVSGRKYKMAEIFAEMMWDVDKPMEADTRYLARKQLQILESKFNLRLFSAFEFEFYFADEKTWKQPTTKTNSPYIMCQSYHDDNAGLLAALESELNAVGVDVEAMHGEYGIGQWEICVRPQFGIKAVDLSVKFKAAVRRVAKTLGKAATFMSNPYKDASCCGFHYNHSLWGNGDTNAFLDASKEDKISDLGRYWIGGLTKHAAALTALCCPTVNDYRRLHRPFVPNQADWGVENRLCTFTFKYGEGKAPYIENRLPGSACCSYIVLAATVAAGIDGITNKIEPPPQNTLTIEEAMAAFKLSPSDSKRDIPKLPKTLEEALVALEQDEVLVKSLGEEFCRWFIHLKRKTDLGVLKDCIVGLKNEEMLEAERAYYFELI